MQRSNGSRSGWQLVCVLLAGLLLGCQVLFGGVEVGSLPSDETLTLEGCKGGAYWCNHEFLLQCNADGRDWTLQETCATADSCNPKAGDCQPCRQGDARCEGASHQVCRADQAAWVTDAVCASEDQCSDAGCSEQCSPLGGIECAAVAGSTEYKLRECVAGQPWKLIDTCDNETLCKDTIDVAKTDRSWSRQCVSAGCPRAGELSCDGQQLRRCPRHQRNWEEVTTCATAALCEATAATGNLATDPSVAASISECNEGCPAVGTYLCSGMLLQKCKEDLTAWEPLEVCSAGTQCNPVEGVCGPLCTPGDYECNQATLRKCQADGTYQDVADCRSPTLCRDGRSLDGPAQPGTCTPHTCLPDQRRCEGATLLKCKASLDGWEPEATCGSDKLCNAESRRCDPIVCMTALAHQCFGQELAQCSLGRDKWDPVTTCPAGQLCDAGPDPGCKLECPRQFQCNGRVLQRCTPSGWVAHATCATDDLCKCTLDPDGAGPLTNSCTLGVGSDACGIPLCGGTKPGWQCQGAELQTCQTGRNGWTPSDTCASAELCYAGNLATSTPGYCAECPVAGELACRLSYTPGSPLWACSPDRKAWNVVQTCSTYGCVPVTNGSDYCANCNVGQTQCSGATLQSCAADRRGFASTTCASALLCDRDDNQCDQCVPNSSSCAGKVLRRCTADGQRIQEQECAGECDPIAGECDSCVANMAWCSNATLNQCSADGQTQTSSLCATPALCDATDRRCVPPTCVVDQPRCNGAEPEVCNPGRNGWMSAGPACLTAELCVAGACQPPVCESGQRRCTGAQPEVCNAGRTNYQPAGAACETPALCIAQTSPTATCRGPTCSVGERTCNGAQPVVCNADRDGWDPVGEACATAGLCRGAGVCDEPVCRVNETRCDGAQRQRCAADRTRWDPVGAPCATAELCLASTPLDTCMPPACSVGQERCNNGAPQICNPGQTDYLADGVCSADQICVENTTAGDSRCTGASCANAQRRCDPNAPQQPQVCNADRSGWDDMGAACTSAQRCEMGACVDIPVIICLAGASRCTNDGQPQTCNAAGTEWLDNGTACRPMARCNPETGTCAECAANEQRCSGQQSQVCTGGTWRNAEDCLDPALCDPASGACTPPFCTPAGSYRCSAQGELQTCDLLDWTTARVCPSDAPLCDAAGRECDQCVTAARECIGSSAYRECDATGHWAPMAVDCDVGQTCSDGECLVTTEEP